MTSLTHDATPACHRSPRARKGRQAAGAGRNLRRSRCLARVPGLANRPDPRAPPTPPMSTPRSPSNTLQVLSWGGYSFVINLLPIYCLACVASGRVTGRHYLAFAPLTFMGTLLAGEGAGGGWGWGWGLGGGKARRRVGPRARAGAPPCCPWMDRLLARRAHQEQGT